MSKNLLRKADLTPYTDGKSFVAYFIGVSRDMYFGVTDRIEFTLHKDQIVEMTFVFRYILRVHVFNKNDTIGRATSLWQPICGSLRMPFRLSFDNPLLCTKAEPLLYKKETTPLIFKNGSEITNIFTVEEMAQEIADLETVVRSKEISIT